MQPLVSVVIPTYKRPQLVKRAVESALSQTLDQIEVIVVMDGPDEETSKVLGNIEDTRLKVIELPTNQGSRAARNAGVRAAIAKWIALLDDDDEWLFNKLELQLEAGQNSQYELPVITSFITVRTPKRDGIWPRRIPEENEPLSEYLFVRNTGFQGEGLIHTSTIFTTKELLNKVPFNTDIQRHDDWDWLLRVITQKGVGVEFVQQVLSIWHLEEARPSLSKSSKWQFSLNWIRDKLDLGLVTPRAYSSFILTEVSARAASSGNIRVFWILLVEAIKRGKPESKDILLCIGMWIIPPKVRSWLRHLLTVKLKELSI
ncbi:glycosyltransferase family 2 protein [Mastigocoleus sp. MO_188.B34]|uniref:glycosyltransferase family 2 protein n=1 Tax=Mastigocoleus sp. MO_188.B34 TaxID=3036635 RepID=UPI00261A7BD9|nr:glycosyltransferase family 2 protein [Mastigocoleus sp. MO_188.B34]MDJ0696980.1 glycosyltransferase family 2 protein [Mastigocoleus sp. MO_188.B34]